MRTFRLNNRVLELNVFPDGKRLATFSNITDYNHGQVIYIGNIATGIIQQQLSSEFAQEISQMGFSEDNQNIVWVSETNAVYSRDIIGEDVQSIPIEHLGLGKNATFSSMSMQVASIVSGYGILIWDITTGKIQTHASLSHSFNDRGVFFSLSQKTKFKTRECTSLFQDDSGWLFVKHRLAKS